MAEAHEKQIDASYMDAKVKVHSDSTPHLTDLVAQATLKYSVKDYDAAADLYSQATELQAEINGELSPQNADLLYAYGRCLYHVAVEKSDVLGSKVAGEKREGSKKPRDKSPGKRQAVSASVTQEKRISEEVMTEVNEKENRASKPEGRLEKGSKPYFRFTGDDNWDTSEEDEDEDDQFEEDSERSIEGDDLVNAYEVLDLARVLLVKKLAEIESAASQIKGDTQEIRQLKERLADTYDLQAEISLEGEKFPTAVVDLKSALELKLALFPRESSLLAEAHYKLSLALEFSSVTQRKDESGQGEAGQAVQVEEAMREEAAREMEAAIASCKLRVQKEEAKLPNDEQTNGDAKKPMVTKGDIEDVKEMISEMEQRLLELRQPPVSIDNPSGTGTLAGSSPLTGIVGSVFAETPAAQKARLEKALENAQDLTNLVKRKRPAQDGGLIPTHAGSKPIVGKRNMNLAEKTEVGTEKKARTSYGCDEFVS